MPARAGEDAMRGAFILAALSAALGCADPLREPSAPVACTGDATITSRADLAAFVARGCTSLSGSLRVEEADLTDLSIPRLTSVEHLAIIANASLVDVALPSLGAVTGRNCPDQYHCDGRGLQILSNPALARLTLPALATVGAAHVAGNGALHELFLPSLTMVEGAEGGASASSYLEPDLEVAYNGGLARLSMPALVHSGALSVEANPALTRLDLSALTAVLRLRIAGNASLPACQPLEVLARLRAAGEEGEALVFGNGTQLACASAALCQGGIAIATSADWAGLVDAGCAEVAGDLTVCATDLRVLDAGPSLRRVDGHLEVQANALLGSLAFPGLQLAGVIGVRDNPELTSLGLPALSASTVVVSGNGGLPDVQLPAFSGGYLVISGNAALKAAGLPAVERLDRLEVVDNATLEQVGAPALSWAMDIALERNPALRTLSFPGLTAIEGRMWCLPKGPCMYQGGSLSVADNAELASVSVPTLATVGGPLRVTTNRTLSTLDAPALSSAGSFLIQDNPAFPQCLAERILAQLAAPPPGGATITGNDALATCP